MKNPNTLFESNIQIKNFPLDKIKLSEFPCETKIDVVN